MCLDHLSRINFTWYISRKVSLWNALFEFSKLGILSIRPYVFVLSWTNGLVHDILLLTRLFTKSCGALFLCQGRAGDMMHMTWFNCGSFPLSEPFFSCPVHLFHVQTPEQWQLPESYIRACVCFTWWLPRCDEACSNGTAQHVAWEVIKT